MRVWLGMCAVALAGAVAGSVSAQEGPASLVGDSARIIGDHMGAVMGRDPAEPPPGAVEEEPAIPDPSVPTVDVETGPSPEAPRRPVRTGILRDRSMPAPPPHPPFDESAFGNWLDKDGDCRDTRNEILAQMSSEQVWTQNGGCLVRRGQWFDPYTGKVLVEANDVGIDHLVPLVWAWENGAWNWDQETRERFANDSANMYVVEMSTIRAKAMAPPTVWMPPDSAFHCAYATRFERIRQEYRIIVPLEEQRALDRVRTTACSP